MDGGREWIGARISWRVEGVGDGQRDVTFEGRIDTAEDFGEGVVRISGALTSGSRFVLVTDAAGMRRDEP
jgi:hypothetical protein